MSPRVLLVPASLAGDPAIACLRDQGLELLAADSGKPALDAARTHDIDAAIVELAEPAGDGIELCRALATERPGLRCVVIGTEPSYDEAVAVLRAGGFDHLTRPMAPDALVAAIRRALHDGELRAEVKRLRTALAETTTFEELVGSSAPMQKLYELLDQAARSTASVLITGESGTGKELVARALHKRSARAAGPFVAVNCSAIPESLLESELFGHVRGAFTDARASRPGLVARASGGTLFLDEIGEMPAALQPKLLRVLQERVVRPVGGDVELPTNVRLVTATNRDLEEQIDSGGFREDLYYRINVIHVPVPPLRSRGSDILALAQHYAEHFALLSNKEITGLSQAANQKLLSYPWPGNVRELQNCMERAVALTQNEELQVDDLPERIREHRASHVLVVGDEPSELVTMDEVEKRYIARVLQAVGGNKREAARVLGFDRKTLYRKIDRYGLRV